MASALDSQKFASRNSVQMWDHDPNTTAATIVTPDAGTTVRYVDMATYGHFSAAAMASTLTGSGITLMEIVARGSSAGTARQVKTSGTIAADAVGDWAFLECTAAEIRQVLSDAGDTIDDVEVAVRLTMQNAADEAVVAYIRSDAQFEKRDLTPDTTIAA